MLQVVALAKRATAIFNCADVGEAFDYAVSSLGKALRIPVAQGQSAGWVYNAEYSSGAPGTRCLFCDTSRAGLIRRWLRCDKEDFCAAAWTTLSGGAADTGAVCEWLAQEPRLRMSGVELPEMVAVALVLVGSPVLRSAADVAVLLAALAEEVLARLAPAHVADQRDLCFIPRAQPPATRQVGSFVLPCMGAAVFLVAAYANELTGPVERNPPAQVTFLLGEGMTDAEQLAYAGMPLSRADRPHAHGPPTATCPLCSTGE